MICIFCGMEKSIYSYKKSTRLQIPNTPTCRCVRIKVPVVKVDQITDEERSMLNYFFIDKGDVTRWVGWEEFSKRHPEIKQEHDHYRERITHAELMFREVLNNI